LQHLVDQRPKIHLDGVELTLDYGDGARKVVDNLGRDVVSPGGCNRAPWTAVAMARLVDAGDPDTRWGGLTSGWTGFAGA
jgi:hypothetical protein